MSPTNDSDAESIQDKTLLAAFDNAKKDYFDGFPGPYVLAGKYSLATFERLSRITESHWGLAYSHDGNQIFIYGDTQPEHELFAGNPRQRLYLRLAEYIGAAGAPPTGIPFLDNRTPAERCLTIVRELGSSIRSLVPRWEQCERTRHPTDRTRDGSMEKEADELMSVMGRLSATGKPMDLMAIELALDNETIAETAWEGQRWVSAQNPARISLTIKIDVGFPLGSCLIGASDLIAENREERSHTTHISQSLSATTTTICQPTL
jgi:hypothetical protein